MSIYQKIMSELDRLGLSRLNSRPYDCSFAVLDRDRSKKKLIIVGFNGSDSDLSWTNASAVQHGQDNPIFSNVEDGATGAWLSATLPNRLLDLPSQLNFEVDSTIYTNAVLLCSKDAVSVKDKALELGFDSVTQLIDRSMEFFENVTVEESEPELIIAYSNSLNNLSASTILFDKFAINEISISNDSNYYKTYSFIAKIGQRLFPVVCVRHLSRYKPCYKSIEDAWKKQRLAIQNMAMTNLAALQENETTFIEKVSLLIGRKEDSVFKNGNACSYHMYKHRLDSKINYIDVIKNKSGWNVQVYFNKLFEPNLEDIAMKAREVTGVGYINKNRDYISSKNCIETIAFDFIRFALSYQL